MEGDPDLTGIVSIHDVMPATMGEVRRLLEWLGGMGVSPVTLLVVPGRDWEDAQLAELGQWVAEGCELAGHGWKHETTPRSVYHRLHAALVSRDVAEHLALDDDGIAELILRCHAWFGDHGFGPPELYVPPAWAMGSISRHRLRTLPFRRFEYLGGVFEAEAGEFRAEPVVGFEADRWWRRMGVELWNRMNLHRARRGHGRVRIGIHPRDRELLMARALETAVRGCARFAPYGDG
jgi:predicted deacetylase